MSVFDDDVPTVTHLTVGDDVILLLVLCCYLVKHRGVKSPKG